MAKWIKNNTVSDKTWVGQLVSAGAYYEIKSEEELDWKTDSSLLSDIGSGDAIVAKDDSGNEDISDVNDAIDYLKDVKTDLEIDDEGRQIQRVAFGKKGWTYTAYPLEFTTSKLNSVFSEDWQGSDRANYSCKFYDSNGNELVAGTQAELDSNCVETRVTMTPSHDYELIAGQIEQHTAPSTSDDIRMWVIGGVIDSTTNSAWEYPTGTFNVSEFAGGINLKFLAANQEIVTDGRASKYMTKTKTGVPYQANQLQFIIRHPVGHKHDLMIILEYFRA